MSRRSKIEPLILRIAQARARRREVQRQRGDTAAIDAEGRAATLELGRAIYAMNQQVLLWLDEMDRREQVRQSPQVVADGPAAPPPVASRDFHARADIGMESVSMPRNSEWGAPNWENVRRGGPECDELLRTLPSQQAFGQVGARACALAAGTDSLGRLLQRGIPMLDQAAARMIATNAREISARALRLAEDITNANTQPASPAGAQAPAPNMPANRFDALLSRAPRPAASHPDGERQPA